MDEVQVPFLLRVFVYEFITGGGLLGDGEVEIPSGSLLAEGFAMLAAVCEDLCLAGHQVSLMWDARLAMPDLVKHDVYPVHDVAEERAQFCDLANSCDQVILIAPETNDQLLTRCQLVEQWRCPLLGPSSCVVSLASDKHQMNRHLSQAGVPVPESILLHSGEGLPSQFCYPAILKPQHGAGSLGVLRMESVCEAERFGPVGQAQVLESYCPGVAASVAILCGPAGSMPLRPCGQSFQATDEFVYTGGWTPLNDGHAERARRLAMKAVGTLGEVRGYIGVDLVLAEEPSTADVVIEINPRLTTSYVGLRSVAKTNLGQAAISISRGEIPVIEFADKTVRFSSSGGVFG